MTTIPFQMLPQGRHTHWCWAAVAASVWRHYHQAPKPICDVVSERVGPHCCTVPTPRVCEIDSFLDEALVRLALLREPTLRRALPLASADAAPSVHSEIAAGRPIGVGINFGGPGHYCVIVGCDAAAGRIAVADPFYGESPDHDYEGFVRAYQHAGVWFETYLLP